MYTEAVQRRFRSRHHAGDLPGATHQGIARAPAGGPFIHLRYLLDDGIVKTPRFKTYGCPVAIACSEVLCELIEGRSLHEIPEITADRISEVLGGVPDEKSHCPILAAQAWHNRQSL